MGNRIKARAPGYDSGCLFWGFQKMDGCKKRGDDQDSHVLSTCPKQNAQNNSAKEGLFDEWNRDCGGQQLTKPRPGDSVAE